MKCLILTLFEIYSILLTPKLSKLTVSRCFYLVVTKNIQPLLIKSISIFLKMELMSFNYDYNDDLNWNYPCVFSILVALVFQDSVLLLYLS